VPDPCPQCGAAFLVEKRSKAGVKLRCIKDGCDYQREAIAPAVVPIANNQ
jgi:ssDNA-binding Zn-finger/Zn-ribbon topoisomerase 1